MHGLGERTKAKVWTVLKVDIKEWAAIPNIPILASIDL